MRQRSRIKWSRTLYLGLFETRIVSFSFSWGITYDFIFYLKGVFKCYPQNLRGSQNILSLLLRGKGKLGPSWLLDTRSDPQGTEEGAVASPSPGQGLGPGSAALTTVATPTSPGLGSQETPRRRRRGPRPDWTGLWALPKARWLPRPHTWGPREVKPPVQQGHGGPSESSPSAQDQRTGWPRVHILGIWNVQE